MTYWYPSAVKTIKIKFTEDEKYCNNTVLKGEKPDINKITVTCIKKTDSNNLKAVVGGTEISAKVN